MNKSLYHNVFKDDARKRDQMFVVERDSYGLRTDFESYRNSSPKVTKKKVFSSINQGLFSI